MKKQPGEIILSQKKISEILEMIAAEKNGISPADFWAKKESENLKTAKN